MKRYDVLIIGGGAAGLAAALSASGRGKTVAVLEGAPRAGRKLLATGNGRCNLINMQAAPYDGDGAFAKKVLGQVDRDAVLRFFHGLGLVTREEGGGRVYPGCGQAAAVLDVMRKALERRDAAVICDAFVKSIRTVKGGFQLAAGNENYEARRVVVACGGMAGGKLGHDGKPYALLTGLGHTLKKPVPALTPLLTEKNAVKGLAGLRLPAILTLCDGTKPIARAAGEVLFTDYGVSGICAMQLSAYVHQARDARLCIDFSPTMGLVPCLYERLPAGDVLENKARALDMLKSREAILPREEMLVGLLPRVLAEKVQGLKTEEMAGRLCAYPVKVTGVRGFEYAQVTHGGINTGDFDPATMESRLQPGLFAAGEMLNVDGDCGGYNLLFAFASGILAGRNAAK